MRSPTCSINSTMLEAQASSLNENGKEEWAGDMLVWVGKVWWERREKSEEVNPNTSSLYTPERQTRVNKETNNSKQSHLTYLASYYHMGTRNNRMAPMHSYTQQNLVIPIITWEQRTIERFQCAAKPSHSFITWKQKTIERFQCAAMRSLAQ